MKLSRNEKMIIWGLVRYPMMNDRQLSEGISIRMSTLNAIKNKLKRTGVVHDRIVPNVEIMDYEILTVTWSPLTRLLSSKKDRELLRDMFGGIPNTYSAMVFGDTLFFLSLYKDYTHYRQVDHRVLSTLRDQGLLGEEEPHSSVYPLSISRLNKNFDYTSVLENAFSIKPVSEGSSASIGTNEMARTKIHHLTNKEKTILKGILRSPDLPDNKIASNLDTTRQAVARHKKELLDLGVIRKSRVIDYGLLGFNILCLAEAHYVHKDGGVLSYPDTSPLHLPSFFSVYGLNETVSLSLFQDFDQFARSRESYTTLMKDHFRIKKEPRILLFSPKDTFTIKHQEYLPLVEDFLGGR